MTMKIRHRDALVTFMAVATSMVLERQLANKLEEADDDPEEEINR